ncbi:STAS/SEC14 domain-containing protein [uncultured Chryseobacterium sp.]|uniref:STAS/SEC14 domain-containing protein n=1 Tax=uncultured Chryseobacterium sp. TaxID=259322 RepID=UPI0025D5663C|nr:STAS/SEC14 domain-containing protein [uncultured Chryseobacterium sp.]
MLQSITTAPRNIAAFEASGEITKEDFDRVIKIVDEKIEQEGELNYLLKLDTPLRNFTFAAWMNDAWLGIKNITKWNRCAIVTDKESVQKFTDMFSKIMIGEFRGFDQEEYDKAEHWVATGQDL